jgi:hypothetical protein
MGLSLVHRGTGKSAEAQKRLVKEPTLQIEEGHGSLLSRVLSERLESMCMIWDCDSIPAVFSSAVTVRDVAEGYCSIRFGGRLDSGKSRTIRSELSKRGLAPDV